MSETIAKYAFFNGRIIPFENAKVGIMTSSFNYGTGVFEGIRAYWSDDEEELYVFRLREHYERFVRNGRFLLIDHPYSVDRLCDATLELLARNDYRTDVYIRPLAYKSTEAIGVRLHDLESGCAIYTLPLGEYIDAPQGARLMVSTWRRVDDNSIPARNKIIGAYVNSALAKTEAHLNGFDDALMLCQDGHVSEASAANLFVVRDGALVTPPVTDDILEGINRATVIELAKGQGLETRERPIDRSELYRVDEVFLCGTGVGLVPVVAIDHRPIGDGQPGPIATNLRALFLNIVRGKEPSYRHWLTPVYHKVMTVGAGCE
jgi:branched-chain amino acid aminotransferase